MGNNKFICGVVLLMPMLSACDDVEPSDAVGFRSAGELYAGNGDIEIHEGDDDDIPDEIIWDVAGGTVSRQVLPGVFEKRMSVSGKAIVDVDQPSWSGPACTIEVAADVARGAVQMLDPSGNVIFTQWGVYAFAGAVDLSGEPDVAAEPALQGAVAFSFHGDKVHAGPWWTGDVIATASAEIEHATPERLLLISALVAGECGSASLP